jgi:hypothetical protein
MLPAESAINSLVIGLHNFFINVRYLSCKDPTCKDYSMRRRLAVSHNTCRGSECGRSSHAFGGFEARGWGLKGAGVTHDIQQDDEGELEKSTPTKQKIVNNRRNYTT